MAEFTVECRRCGRTMQLIGPIEINYIDECSMCDEDRVSLPKRGDRVRVTEVPQGRVPAYPLLGKSIELASDAEEHPQFPGYLMLIGEPVKVEILERASDRDCAQCSPVFTEEPHPCAICGGSGKVPRGKLDGLTPEQCQAFATEEHAGFARGMRRAVEIAEGIGFGAYGNRSLAYVDELKEAVEKELKP